MVPPSLPFIFILSLLMFPCEGFHNVFMRASFYPAMTGRYRAGSPPTAGISKQKALTAMVYTFAEGKAAAMTKNGCLCAPGFSPCHDFSVATDPIPRKAFIPTALLPMKSSVSSFLRLPLRGGVNGEVHPAIDKKGFYISKQNALTAMGIYDLRVQHN